MDTDGWVEDCWVQCSDCGWEGFNSEVLVDEDDLEFCPECWGARVEPAQDLDVSYERK